MEAVRAWLVDEGAQMWGGSHGFVGEGAQVWGGFCGEMGESKGRMGAKARRCGAASAVKGGGSKGRMGAKDA